MPTREIAIAFSAVGDRNSVRKRVILSFAEEVPGTGKGDNCSKYIYYVETLRDGRRIYLERPGFLNKQFDFRICVENMNFNTDNRRERPAPTHKDIFSDLSQKKIEAPNKYRKLYNQIVQLYECKTEVGTESQNALTFPCGYPADLLMGVIKWYFIEQDIAYWNYSGRAMFMSGIPTP